ncbi:MAG: hypothetical protein JWP60_3336 [Ramlibacter sp.]|nr:hypothetical protein [Ramlibacter sp.]
MLNRAIMNYWSLRENLSLGMARFIEDRSENDGTDDIC